MNESKKQIQLAVEKFTPLVRGSDGVIEVALFGSAASDKPDPQDFDERKKYLGRICQRSVCPTTSVECYVKDCGKIKYLRQLDRFVFDDHQSEFSHYYAEGTGEKSALIIGSFQRLYFHKKHIVEALHFQP